MADMTDDEILSKIHELVAEEQKLRDRHADGKVSQQEEQERVRRLDVALDQCWDLLRQRRARKEFGEDPGEAQARSAGVVEGYQQ